MSWRYALVPCLLLLAGTSAEILSQSSGLSLAIQRLWLGFWQHHRGTAAPSLPPTPLPDKQRVTFLEKNDETLLTTETFDGFVSQFRAVFINYCSSRTGICDHVAPEWRRFREVARVVLPDVGVAKVDCDRDSALCQARRVRNFPTLRWYDDRQVQNYHGVLSTRRFVHIAARNMNRTASFFEDEAGTRFVSVH